MIAARLHRGGWREPSGGLPGVETWDEARDARTACRPGNLVVAHPPRQSPRSAQGDVGSMQNGVDLPSLRWGEGAQRLDPVMLERHGYEYARRKGLVSMVGGKRKTEIRNATPPEFRDLLLSIAATAAARLAA